jgi:hypothetical protein
MNKLWLDISNEEADALRIMLPRIRKRMLLPIMSGDKHDLKDSATPTYMVLERLLRQLGNANRDHTR